MQRDIGSDWVLPLNSQEAIAYRRRPMTLTRSSAQLLARVNLECEIQQRGTHLYDK